jgi:mono/diheme cytochrome c family protein
MSINYSYTLRAYHLLIRFMKKLIILSLALYLVGCAASKKTAEAGLSQKDVDRVQDKFPGFTLAELNEGKALYEKHCGTCHGLKPLDGQTEEGWRNIVPPMVKKANRKEGNVIDERGEDLILKYVVTMGPAKAGK